MTPLPDQHPPRRRPVPLRPRTDVYRTPRFRPPLTPRVVLPPTESFDSRNEPRDLSWDELADPVLIVAAIGTVLGGGLVLVFWFTT